MDDFQLALEGKTSTEGWTAEKLVDYHRFVQKAATEEESKVGGLREAKRVESERVQKLKDEAERIQTDIDAKKQQEIPKNPEMTQFRTEQVNKAKNRFYAEFKLSEQDRAAVEEKFTRLDTGKLDAEFIYDDLLSAFAAANPKRHVELTRSREEQERLAAEEIEAQAGGGGGSGGNGGEVKKFSDEVMTLAKKAGITPEAAKRQVEGGMSRTY